MLQVMSTSKIPKRETEQQPQQQSQGLGPGQIAILNPKAKEHNPRPVEPSLSRDSPAPENRISTPLQRSHSQPPNLSSGSAAAGPAPAKLPPVAVPSGPKAAENAAQAPPPHMQSLTQPQKFLQGPVAPQVQQPAAPTSTVVPEQGPRAIPAPVAPPEGNQGGNPGNIPRSAPLSVPPSTPSGSGSGAHQSTMAPASESPDAFAAPIPHSSDHVCSNCGVTDTPLWRRGLRGEIMCNACGLYVKSRRISRPAKLKRSPRTKIVQNQENAPGTCPGGGQCNGTGGSQACSECPTFNNRTGRAKMTQRTQEHVLISCQNCGTVTTPLWRRDSEGNTICNACGLYLRMHHEHRPVKMVKNTIKRRKRAVEGDEVKSPPDNDSPAPSAPSSSAPPRPPQSSSGHEQRLYGGQDQQLALATPHRPNSGASQISMPIDFTTEHSPPQDGQQRSLGLPMPAGVPSYQPLSLLEYLSGDSKKEYLLAVRRQLQDKVSHIEIQLSEFNSQLAECDKALEKLK